MKVVLRKLTCEFKPFKYHKFNTKLVIILILKIFKGNYRMLVSLLFLV